MGTRGRTRERRREKRRQQGLFTTPKQDEAKTSRATSPAFRLLDLPPELFLHICRYAVPSKMKFGLGTTGNGPMIMQPPITRVCRILREELLPMFYTNNIFTYTDGSPTSRRLTSFLERIPVSCEKGALKILVGSIQHDTQAFLEGSLQFIGYRLQRWNTGTGLFDAAGAGGMGKLAHHPNCKTFRVVRRS
ncbi:hypothetical protein LTR10_002948 [Elasticomyces elasticus]|nr:hypothetical protein LTR10_002948 [Elasticomyces elasticus]KAK4967715.1 hypothetical protein LTR42_010040 [Elasticomyces elasticus]